MSHNDNGPTLAWVSFRYTECKLISDSQGHLYSLLRANGLSEIVSRSANSKEPCDAKYGRGRARSKLAARSDTNYSSTHRET